MYMAHSILQSLLCYPSLKVFNTFIYDHLCRLILYVKRIFKAERPDSFRRYIMRDDFGDVCPIDEICMFGDIHSL